MSKKKHIMSSNAFDYVSPETAKMLEHAISRLRKEYKKELDNRKCVKIIKTPVQAPITIIRDMNTLINSHMPTTSKPVGKVVKQPKSAIAKCTATKLDGTQCSFNAKSGGSFCGRHMNKT